MFAFQRFTIIERQERQKHIIHSFSGDTLIKNDLKGWPMSEWTRKHYGVCVFYRHWRNNRSCSGKHQAEALGFFLLLE